MLIISVNTFAMDLILSPQLKLQYDEPTLISHTSDTLIVKYDNWYFSHNVINPKVVYASIDLTGIDVDFFTAIFEPSVREGLPPWLASLADEQAKTFGANKNNTLKRNVGEALLYGVYDDKNSQGEIFLIEASQQIHHFSTIGNRQQFSDVINNIKER